MGVDICHTFVQPKECATLSMNPKVNYGLWLIIMWQCRFILGKQYAILVNDAGNLGGHACLRQRAFGKSVPSFQLYYKQKTALK